ncbi:MAG TPA: recombinase family protein [Candidatus Limnocylindrales bacterium]|nr:recombinase family protein [Candidatus Limnocylindrales bacterium]
MPNAKSPDLPKTMSARQVSAAELDRRTRIELRAEYDRYLARRQLTHDDLDSAAALYARESVPDSLVGDAAAAQLRSALDLLAGRGSVPPWENVYFENVSGTELASRQQFQELLERAAGGEFQVIGAYLSSRLFRNADEASAVKKQLRRKGVELLWLGKPTGIDERDPSVWFMERNMDTQDEMHSRQTGWLVGRQLEYKTRKGEPLGHLPECWEVVEWAASNRPGQRGRPIRWELAQPMASIVQAGAARYLSGSSFRQVALWSEGTELGGVTPKNRTMDWVWWNMILKNPKIAGLHAATRYPGYKPGKEFQSNHQKGVVRELVPCLLPALISIEDFEAIQARSRASHARGGVVRARPDHAVEILSGIAFDARCGHRLHTARHADDDYLMRCNERGFNPHGSAFPARHAGDELDALVAAIRFDDRLVVDLERRLADRAREAAPVQPAPVAPAVARLRSAIAAMRGDEDLADVRRSLEAKLALLEQQAPRRARPSSPAAVFRAAVDSIARWGDAWASASADEKNKLLRAAGVTAIIEPVPHRHFGRKKVPGPRSRLVLVQAAVPEFGLALRVGARLSVDGVEPTEHESRPSNDNLPRARLLNLPRVFRHDPRRVCRVPRRA